MHLERLEQFLAVVDTGTVTQAARQVHLTQPALSRNLKLLEEELGAALFERRGRRLALTPAGRALVPHARALLEQAQGLERAIHEVATRHYFDLRLGTVDSVATHLFPGVIGPLHRDWPKLQLKFRTGRTADLLARLSRNELDMAIVAWKGKPPGERVTRVGPYLRRYRGRIDRFAALYEATTEADVQRFPIIEIEAQPGQPTLIPEDATTFATCGSLASVKALVLGGFGVGALLDFMLTPSEDALLTSAQVPPEPDCYLYVLGAPGRSGERAEAIEQTVVDALRVQLHRCGEQ